MEEEKKINEEKKNDGKNKKEGDQKKEEEKKEDEDDLPNITIYYTKQDSDSQNSKFIKLVAKRVKHNIGFKRYKETTIDLDNEADQGHIAKSLTGSFPVLGLNKGNGIYLSEPLTIAKYLSTFDKSYFYGADIYKKTQIDQWLDIISLTLVPQSEFLIK